MYRTLADIEGRYAVVPPGEGVSLAEIHNVPYPIPDYAALQDDGGHVPRIVVHPGSYEYPDTLADAGGFSPADMRALSPMPVASPEAAPPSAGISFADLVGTISTTENPNVWDEANSAPYWHMPPAAVPDTWNDNREPEQTAEWSPAVVGGTKSWTFGAPFGALDPRSAADMGSPRVPATDSAPAQPSLTEKIAALGQALPDYFMRGGESPAPEPTAEQIRNPMGSFLDRSPLDRPSFARQQSQAYRGQFFPFSKDDDGNAYFDPDTGIVGSLKSGLTLAGDVAAGRIELYGPDGRLTPEAIERLFDMAGLPAGGIGGGGRVAARSASAPKRPLARLPLEHVPGMTPERARKIRALIGDEQAEIHAFPNKPLRPYEADFPGRPPGLPGAELPVLIGGAQRIAKYTVGRRVVQGLDEAITPRELNELVKEMTGSYPIKVPGSRLDKDVIAKYNRDKKLIYVWDQLDPATMHKAVAHEFGHHLANIVKGLADDMPPRLEVELAPLYHWGYKGNNHGRRVTPMSKDYPLGEAREELLVEAIRAYLTNPNYLKTVAPETAAYLRGKLNTHKNVRGHVQFNSKTGGSPAGLGTPPDRRRREPWPPRA